MLLIGCVPSVLDISEVVRLFKSRVSLVGKYVLSIQITRVRFFDIAYGLIDFAHQFFNVALIANHNYLLYKLFSNRIVNERSKIL